MAGTRADADEGGGFRGRLWAAWPLLCWIVPAVLVAVLLIATPSSPGQLGLLPVGVIGALLAMAPWYVLRRRGHITIPVTHAVLLLTGMGAWAAAVLAMALAGHVLPSSLSVLIYMTGVIAGAVIWVAMLVRAFTARTGQD